VQKYGVDTLEGMNAAGGGTNQPKIVSGTTYAKGGGMIGGGRFAQTPGGGLDPRFLSKLGELGVPGTGSVMAPLSSGPKDIYGNQQTGANYQNKLFGMNIGNPFGHQDGASGQYDSNEKSRYEKMTGRKFIPTLYGDYRGTEQGMPGLTRPTRVPRQSITSTDPKKENDKFIGESFRDFGTNVKKIKGSSKRKEEMMREMGYKPDGYVNLSGRKIIKKQGGGLFGGTRTPGTSEHPYMKQMDLERIKKQMNLPPGKGFTGKYDMMGNPTGYGVKGGGLIGENTGIDIPGGGADRQNVRVQPGEYIIPKKVVDNIGVNLLDKRVANIDKNSNPSKLGAGRQIEPQSPSISRLNPAQIQTQNNVPKINPPSKSKVKVVYATSPGGIPKLNTSSGASPSVPSFSAVHPNSESRRRNAAVLGVR